MPETASKPPEDRREYMREYFARRYAEDPEFRARRRKADSKCMDAVAVDEKRRRLDVRLAKKFKVPLEEIQALELICQICGATDNLANGRADVYALCVDHDHKTGKIRGKLCSNCNTALGKFRDSKELLQAAIDYLKRFEES